MALADQLFWACARGTLNATSQDQRPQELDEAPLLLSDIYYCNFSVFQSLPDSWAVDQLFPVCPIHRLDEPPDRTAVLADITCDSDGQIGRFPTPRSIPAEMTIPLHSLKDGEPYYLGVFLVGAYQQVLGDLHNLFGETHAVHVSLDGADGWHLDEYMPGDTVQEVLGYVRYDTDALKQAMQQSIEAATQSDQLTIPEGQMLLDLYEQGLNGSTYLD